MYVYYYLAINIFGLVLNLIVTTAVRKYGRPGKDYLLKLTAIAGGGFGLVLSDLLLAIFRKKPDFRNIRNPEERDEARHRYNKAQNVGLFLTVYAAAWAVLHGMICFLALSDRRELCLYWLSTFYQDHRILCIYLILINVVTWILFMLDKVFAVTHRWRVSERLLLLLSFLGGAPGGYLAMDLFNHKVSAKEFASGLPVMIFVQMLLMMLVTAGLL